MKLTNAQARRFLISLHFEDERAEALDPVDQIIHHARRMGCIQYDPLNVVGRNPDLVLQSRIKSYKPAMLHEALYDRRTLIDGFDKNLAMYPTVDFPAFKRLRDRYSAYGFANNEEVINSLDEVRARLLEKGALCSDDFGWTEKVSWPWGSANRARAALETMWMHGDLILSHRKGSRRYFDLIERHIDLELIAAPDPFETDHSFYTWNLRRRIGSVGLLWNRGSDAFLGIDGFKTAEKNAAFAHLIADDELIEVEVENVDRMLFALRRDEEILARAMGEATSNGVARVIAPLDNFLWDRRLIETVFGFMYRWEVYVPKPQRKYGYYVLPVLYGDRFVARFEPANFRSGELVILNWWWEDGVKVTKKMKTAIDWCLKRFCRYLGADGYRIDKGFE